MKALIIYGEIQMAQIKSIVVIFFLNHPCWYYVDLI